MERQWKGGGGGNHSGILNISILFSKYWHAKLCWTPPPPPPPPPKKKLACALNHLGLLEKLIWVNPWLIIEKKIKDNISEKTVFVCWIAIIIKWIYNFKELFFNLQIFYLLYLEYASNILQIPVYISTTSS